MAELKNGQSCLEKQGIEERDNEIIRSDYNINNEYGPTNTGEFGRGTGGSHTHWLPDCEKPKDLINYSNFSTSPDMNIGNVYDIEGRNDIGGRNKAINSSKYNYLNQYTANLVDSSENIAQGQYYTGRTIKNS